MRSQRWGSRLWIPTVVPLGWNDRGIVILEIDSPEPGGGNDRAAPGYRSR